MVSRIALTLVLLTSPLHAGQGPSSLLDGPVTLRNGAVVSSRFADNVVGQLKKLHQDNWLALYRFYHLCRGGGNIPPGEEAQLLCNLGLVIFTSDQICQIRSDVSDIVLSCITVDGCYIDFRSPYPGNWCPCFTVEDELLLDRQA